MVEQPLYYHPRDPATPKALPWREMLIQEALKGDRQGLSVA